MAGTIKGITIDIGGNTAPLNKALEGVNKTSRDLQAELKQVERLLKLDPTNTELLSQKQKLLAESVDNTKQKLDTLKEAEKQVQEQVQKGKISEEQYRAFQREVASTEVKLKSLTTEQQKYNSKCDDTVTEIKDVTKSFDNAGDKALSFGDVLKANVISDAVVGGVKNLGDAIKDIAIQTGSATGTIQAKLGTTKEEAEKLTEVAKAVWKDGFGDGISDVTSDLAVVKQYLGNISDEELQGVLKNAYTISDVFGSDVNESVKSVKTMMSNFGISSNQAFDLITSGFQNGLDYSGEFLDTLNEYSPQFASMGLSADEAMKMLKNGVDNGAFSLDKVADSMKEFNIRIKDGSNTTKEGLKTLGIDYDNLMKQINSGTMTTGDAMQLIVDKLKEQKDTTTQNLAGVNLFGTQWEDVGKDVILSLNNVNGSLDNVNGSTSKAGDAVQNNLGTKFEKASRGMQEAFSPLAEQLLDLTNNIMPDIQGFLQWITDNSSFVIALIAGIGAGFITWNVASMISGVVKAIKAFQLANEGATIAQWALNAAQNANPIGIIVMLIAGLVTAIITLWNTNEDFRNAVIGIWDKIKGAMKTAIDAVVKVLGNIIDFFKQLPDKIWNGLLSIITKFIEWRADLLTWISTNFVLIISSIVDFFKSLPGKVWNAIVGIIEKFANIKSELIKWANNNLPSFIAKFVEFMLDLPKKMGDIGKNIVHGIWDGISGAVGWLKDKITGFAGGIVDNIKEKLSIHSPSRVLADEVGKYMAQGIGVGFENEMSSVSTNMAKAIPTNKHDYSIKNPDSRGTDANNVSGGFSVKIENFINNRTQDVQAFAEELEFYRKQRNTGMRGAY